MMMRVLNSCHGVMVYGEHLGQLVGAASSWRMLVNHREFNRFCSQTRDQRDVAELAHYRLKDPNYFSAVVNGLSIDHVRFAYTAFLTSFANPFGRTDVRWGFKEVRYGKNGDDGVADLIMTLLPEAKIVLTVRNPVDQVFSKASRGWWPESFGDNIVQWSAQAGYFKDLADRHPDVVRLVRHEDMNDGHLKPLLQWLGLEWGQLQENVLKIRNGETPKDKIAKFTPADRALVEDKIDWGLANSLGYFKDSAVPEGEPVRSESVGDDGPEK